MKNCVAMDRREMLAALVQWSGAALSVAGLGGLATGCAGSGGGGAERATPSRAASSPAIASNSNYFDYANYANYINGPGSDYGDYSNYTNYSNYYDYFDGYGDMYAEAYADIYSDTYTEAYADSYSDSTTYSNYSEYGDYSEYSDYSDYSDSNSDGYSDASSDLAGAVRLRPLGAYADYADVYADSGALPSGAGTLVPVQGRAKVTHPPFRGQSRHLVKGKAEAVHGSGWIDETDARPRSGAVAAATGAEGARQGKPDELQRPERQKQGRRSRTIAGPSNRPGGAKGGSGTGR